MEEKIEAIMQQLTLAEKVALLAGADMWHTVTIDRVGIPAMKVSDGPNGVRGVDDNTGPSSACFPVGTALGATWNPALVEQVGQALAEEVKAKGAHVLLAPTVNIHRSPIAGRNFECYAEDPFLSGTLASAYINGLQSRGVGACIKHFVCNDSEYERHSMSSEVAERPLREIYLEPFRIALEKAHPWTIMSSYNRINGTWASENSTLLRDILKGEWGYDGLVISDWYGSYTENVAAGGLDLEMPGPARWHDDRVRRAVENGELDEALVDDKVRRLLRTLFRVGAFDQPELQPERSVDRPEDRQLARTAAAEAIVLLKNEGDLLPLDPHKPQRIAVIGENAQAAQIMGGGSSSVNPHYAISPLAGIRQRVGDDVHVDYALGCAIHRRPRPVPVDWLRAGENGRAGLHLAYFGNPDLAGEPVHTAVVQKTDLHWFGESNPYIDPSNFSLRLSGQLVVPQSGPYTFNLESNGASRVLLDGEPVLDRWQAGAVVEMVATLELVAGQPYDLILEYSAPTEARGRFVRLGCQPPQDDDPVQTAVDLAAVSDVAIVVAGLTKEWESEGFDRPDMELVGAQNELIARVAAANPNTIVVLNVGSPVTMPWLDAVTAVLQLWYPGQEGGNALADVLFGEANPSGRLPTTFPRRLADTPAYINYPGENGKVLYGEGLFVGYRYYDKKEIEPLFPFGHGLSYTTFAYNNLEIAAAGQSVQVQVDVTNTGRRAGQEVVQLYVQDDAARLIRPLKELKAFAKVHLEPGETETVTLTLSRQSLAFYDPALGDWATEPGTFTVLVGHSAQDIRLSGQFSWAGDEAPASRLHTGLPLQTLLSDPRGTAVLQEYLGDLLNHPEAEMAMSMSLEQIANFAPDVLSRETIAAINQALAE
ncbi:MAG: glycoside hydrolase family 3 C-terminal domain-containing protein [Ardenticatenaceae bacterium]|nr:glycoside hydrolase family 3 C-terminal domain-containing protein [Ardenticatenaceae bacterium]MCB8987752.1 glycoside hydrolase family 3 C-terminal domain-containing protein [Ardenticatenaceae bacterium]